MGHGILLIEAAASKKPQVTPASRPASEAALPTASIGAALAQDTTELAEIVIVTGSYIRGSAEDAALPIDVISAEELQNMGSPSTVELLKNLSVSSGALGDSNQFAASARARRVPVP